MTKIAGAGFWRSGNNAGGGGANTLNQAYNEGGPGAGREIVADAGAVKITGTDGFIVEGTEGAGADSEFIGPGTVMLFNPAKGAFRAGTVRADEWDNSKIGETSFAVGDDTVANGINGFASGAKTIAQGSQSFAAGHSSFAFGNQSVAMGYGTKARSLGEMAFGLHPTNYTPISTVNWEPTDRLFVIGNGINDAARADALIITKDGNVTMPTTTGAFSPPVLTTTQRDALTATAGMMIFNSTTSKHQGYDGAIWNDLY